MASEAETKPVDIGELIDQGPWGALQKAVLGLVFLVLVIDGIANQVLAIALPALIKDWHIPREAFATVTAIGLIGLAAGALGGGYLADRLGRKVVLLGSMIIFTGATIAISLAHNIETFAILRVIDGLGIGAAIPTGSTLASEFTPLHRRGRAVSLAMLSIPLGNVICGLLGAAILPAYGWRALFLINGGFGLAIALLLIFVLPESPRFLYRSTAKHNELFRVLGRMGFNLPARTRLSDVQHGSSGGGNSLRMLFSADLRRSSAGLLGGFFFVFLAVYALIGWIPTMLSSHRFSLSLTSASLSAYSAGGILGGLVWIGLCEKLGTRPAFIIVASASVACAVVLSVLPLDPAGLVWPVMVALAALGFSMNAFVGGLYTLGAFIYPPSMRASGMGAASSVGRLGAIVSAYAAVAAIAFGGGSFFLVAAAAILVGLFCLLSVPRQLPPAAAVRRASATN